MTRAEFIEAMRAVINGTRHEGTLDRVIAYADALVAQAVNDEREAIAKACDQRRAAYREAADASMKAGGDMAAYYQSAAGDEAAACAHLARARGQKG